jgi:succinylglutamate desuccinylase
VLNYLETDDGFIKLSSKTDEQTQALLADITETVLPNLVTLNYLERGILQITPKQTAKDLTNTKIVISCAIHGNETAPIEIVSRLISEIAKGKIEPQVELLFILGNPESMLIGDRFVSINMNRLFAGAYKKYTVDQTNQYELKRAEQLEQIVSDFFADNDPTQPSIKQHFDLHTAIKPSYHKTFAIRPHCASAISQASKDLLSAMGIEAVLQHKKVSTTFSYFSVEKFNAEAYTLELGKVKKFGDNIKQDFVKAEDTLTALIKNQPIQTNSENDLIEYKVVAEIIKNSEDFKFYIEDNVENFTPFPQGYLIAEDIDYNYRVAFEQESVVFPNVNVPVGQRVAVMVAKQES